jgi:glycosyltransferase involved in cell wall biosynthesis
MTEDVTISVITAAYRAQETLAATVASVRAQTRQDWELIVVADDGVDYRGHVGNGARQDSRVRFMSSGGIGTGPAAARNAGLAVASGRFVAALDADDRFAPERLDVLLAAAEGSGVAADCVNVVDTDGVTLRHAFPPGSPDREIGADDIMDCGVPLHPLVRRDLLGEGWPALRFAEDVLLNLQVLDRAGRYVMVMRPLYDYVVHPASICHRPDAAEVADAAYGRILDGLQSGAFGLSPPANAVALAGFQGKRETNRAFARAQAAGLADSFQAFLALEQAP